MEPSNEYIRVGRIGLINLGESRKKTIAHFSAKDCKLLTTARHAHLISRVYHRVVVAVVSLSCFLRIIMMH